MSDYEFPTPEEAGNIRNCKKECDELKAQLEKAHKFIFDNYPDHFKAWSVKNNERI